MLLAVDDDNTDAVSEILSRAEVTHTERRFADERETGDRHTGGHLVDASR